MIIYHIYPLGLCNALFENEYKEPVNRLEEIYKWIPHIKDMGFDTIYFGPLFESKYHGYDTTDYYKVDSRLGTNEDFKKLCMFIKNQGLKIVLDGVFNHVGRDFWAFKDLQQYREKSYHCDWFNGLNFNSNNDRNDGFSYNTWGGYTSLVKLNLRNSYVCDHLLKAVEMWIKEFDIDGLRLDAADQIDLNFFNQLKDRTRAIKPDFWLMGEIVSGDYQRFLDRLDSTTNYALYKSMFSAFNSKNMFEYAHGVEREFGPYGLYKNKLLYNFVDNHDVNRIVNTLNDKENLKNVYTLMFMIPGIPSVYYGSEWGITGTKHDGSDNDLRPYINIDETHDNDLTNHIKELIKIKKESNALMYGGYEKINIWNMQYAFARMYDNELKIVLVNAGDNDFTFDFWYRNNHYNYTLPKKSSKII